MSSFSQTPAKPDDLATVAASLDIALDSEQLHIGGERALMSPHKYVLTGAKKNSGAKVVMKCATHERGVAEIISEHEVQTILTGLAFTEQELIMPTELFYGTKQGYQVSVTEFIDQEKVFTDYSLQDQFFMTLHAFEAQESFHATTREHHQAIRHKFTHHSPAFYLQSYEIMKAAILKNDPDATSLLDQGLAFLKQNTHVLHLLDRYLIHSDLVPHNFRIQHRQLYLLDFVSFRLGNKYEGWARFINFMEVHNPDLIPLLLTYLKTDRNATEYLSLRLMRVYKICFLLDYYTNIRKETEGDLLVLTEARITFWKAALSAVLNDTNVPIQTVKTYHEKRAALRTEKEKARQRQFTWV